MKTARIVIVDDQQIVRVGVETLVKELSDTFVVGTAANKKELADILKKETVDVVFMDIHLGTENGIALTREIVSVYPRIKVIALTIEESISLFNEMMNAGASGFLLKSAGSEDLKKAIEAVMNGGSYFSKEFAGLVNVADSVRSGKKIVISEREKNVLELISKGFSNNEIAGKLKISIYTADQHRRNLLLKTEAKNSAELVSIAFKEGLLE